MSPPALLDPYAGLDPGDEHWLREQTDRIHAAFGRAAAETLAIGRIIRDVKQKLGHGFFLSWVADALPFGASAALKMMQAADAFGDQIRNGYEFQPTALYLLAQPSTTPEARAKALELAAGGHRITAAVARAIIRELAAAVEHDPRPAKLAISPEILRVLVPNGEREAHYDLSFRIDPDDDLIVGVGGETGRDLAAVLAALAERVRAAARPYTFDPRDPALIDWCDAIAGGVAGSWGLTKGDQKWELVRDHARQTLLECCKDFKPEIVRPDSTPLEAFKGWAHQTIRREASREAERVRNGGTYRTKRPGIAAPSVGPLPAEVC